MKKCRMTCLMRLVVSPPYWLIPLWTVRNETSSYSSMVWNEENFPHENRPRHYVTPVAACEHSVLTDSSMNCEEWNFLLFLHGLRWRETSYMNRPWRDVTPQRLVCDPAIATERGQLSHPAVHQLMCGGGGGDKPKKKMRNRRRNGQNKKKETKQVI